MGDCPCANLLILPYRDRVVAFVPEVGDELSFEVAPHVIFSRSRPPRARHGRSRVVCACEPGWTRIGGSTAVLYGLDDAALLTAFAAVPDPIVIVALYSESTPGVSVAQIVQACAASGRTCHVTSFDHVVLRSDPSATPPVQAV